MGFNIGGMFKSLVNPMTLMQVAMGPAGWASIAAKMVMSAVGQQVIQQLGEKLGLPQSMIDGAQAAFCAACGDKQGVQRNIRETVQGLSEQGNWSSVDAGKVERQANTAADNLTKMMMRQIERSGGADAETLRSGGKGGGSLLMKIAIAMGQLMDQKMSEMDGLTTDIGKLGTIDKKNQSKMGELTGKLQGLGQEVSLLSNAMTNTIKSIGEANSTIARKG